MAKYTGKPSRVPVAADVLFARFDDLTQIQEKLSQLPEDFQAKMGTVTFPDKDSLSFTAPGVGQMSFRIVERQAPDRIRMLADTGLVPVNIDIVMQPAADSQTDIHAVIDADIPMMLRPMVGPKLQEAADKFGEMFSGLNAF